MNPDQLQQALQQRGIFVQALVAFKETGDELEDERDAAIERGVGLWRMASLAEVACASVAADVEAAEALLLRIHKVCEHTLEGDRSSGWYKMVVFDIGQLTTPAEAQGRRRAAIH